MVLTYIEMPPCIINLQMRVSETYYRDQDRLSAWPRTRTMLSLMTCAFCVLDVTGSPM